MLCSSKLRPQCNYHNYNHSYNHNWNADNYAGDNNKWGRVLMSITCQLVQLGLLPMHDR